MKSLVLMTILSSVFVCSAHAGMKFRCYDNSAPGNSYFTVTDNNGKATVTPHSNEGDFDLPTVEAVVDTSNAPASQSYYFKANKHFDYYNVIIIAAGERNNDILGMVDPSVTDRKELSDAVLSLPGTKVLTKLDCERL